MIRIVGLAMFLVIVLVLFSCFTNWFLSHNVTSTESFGPLQSPDEDDNLFEINRRALMDSYNSQVMAHGAYIVALAVAMFAILSQWNNFNSITYRRYLALFLVALILSGVFYFSLRIVFWAYIATDVLAINPNELVGNSSDTSISRIHGTTITRFNQNSGFSRELSPLTYFAGNKADLWDRLLFIGGVTFTLWLCLLAFYLIVKPFGAKSKNRSLEQRIGKRE